MDPALMSCGAYHLVCWFWAFWEGLWFRCCLLLAVGNMFGATSDSPFVAASTGPGYMLEGPSCTLRLAFTSNGPSGRSAKVPRHPEICLRLPLPGGCLRGLAIERTIRRQVGESWSPESGSAGNLEGGFLVFPGKRKCQ